MGRKYRLILWILLQTFVRTGKNFLHFSILLHERPGTFRFPFSNSSQKCGHHLDTHCYQTRWRLKSLASRFFTNRLFRCRSQKTSKLRVTGLCAGNSPVTGEFLAQMTSYAENVYISWRHRVHTVLNYTKPSFVFISSDFLPPLWCNPVPSWPWGGKGQSTARSRICTRSGGSQKGTGNEV